MAFLYCYEKKIKKNKKIKERKKNYKLNFFFPALPFPTLNKILSISLRSAHSKLLDLSLVSPHEPSRF